MVGRVADDVFNEPGIVNGVELAPLFAGARAHNWSTLPPFQSNEPKDPVGALRSAGMAGERGRIAPHSWNSARTRIKVPGGNRGGQVGEANGVHALAQQVGEVLENRCQLQDGRFFTHSEPMPDDKGSED